MRETSSAWIAIAEPPAGAGGALAQGRTRLERMAFALFSAADVIGRRQREVCVVVTD